MPAVAASSPMLGMLQNQWSLQAPTELAAGIQLLVVHSGAACPEAVEYASLMCGMPAWTDVSEGEICKEEYRRLAWSSLLFAASHSSYDTSDSAFSPQMDLFIMDSTNVMFPAEHLEWKHGLPTPLSKNSIWTLCMCILLLWHSCMCVRLDPSLSKAQFAFTSWLEMNAVGDAMDRHTCVDELNFIQGHEILFDSRMHISFELQQFIQPAYAGAKLLLYDKKAEDW
ncbi:hypothetical protein A0H81_01415 [Grifola frondosa]|uniref:Uncharacterized protein n=1 Tax=Grifola frondosa TaxID=5627 RepID=A0A1C7MSJ6_GRIFR|nr:hypothetical protein A0H81_01415 [Grifola frondosa]